MLVSQIDLHGHLNGDKCLRQIARTIADALPPEAGMVSRSGGEELAVIFPGAVLARAAELGELVRSAIERLNLPHAGSPLGIQTISVGIAAKVPCPASNEPDLL